MHSALLTAYYTQKGVPMAMAIRGQGDVGLWVTTLKCGKLSVSRLSRFIYFAVLDLDFQYCDHCLPDLKGIP